MTENLIPIPRIESRAPNKNTIEWEIPGKVSVGLMSIDKVDYVVIAKVKIKKQHWWNRSWKTFTTKSHNPAEAIINALDALEKYGFYIDANSIQYGERVGNPNYFEKK